MGRSQKTVLHAKTAASVFPDAPGYTGPAAAEVQADEAEGITATSVALDPNATDYVGALEAAGVAKRHVLSLNGTPAACVEVAQRAQAAERAGDPRRLEPAVPGGGRQAGAGRLPEVVLQLGSGQPGRGAVRRSRRTTSSWRRTASRPAIEDPWYCTAFSEILTAAQFMNSIAKEKGFAKVTPATVNARRRSGAGRSSSVSRRSTAASMRRHRHRAPTSRPSTTTRERGFKLASATKTTRPASGATPAVPAARG